MVNGQILGTHTLLQVHSNRQYRQPLDGTHQVQSRRQRTHGHEHMEHEEHMEDEEHMVRRQLCSTVKRSNGIEPWPAWLPLLLTILMGHSISMLWFFPS